MIKIILDALLKHSSLKKDEHANAVRLIEASDAVLPKIILIFVSFFMLNIFLFLTVASVVLMVFATISHFGNINDLLNENDLPVNIKLYFLLAGVVTSTLAVGFFKMMMWAWRKTRKPKKEELKLKF